MDNSPFPYLLIFFAAALWALLGVATALLLDAGLGAMEIALWPAVIGGVLFGVHAVVGGHLTLHRWRDLGIFVPFALVAVTLFFAAFNFTVETGGITLAVVLLYTAPAFVVGLAAVVLDESITVEKLLGVGLVIAGVTLIAFDGTATGLEATPESVGWGLTAGFCFAVMYVVGKRLLERYHPVTIYAYILPIGAVGLLPFVEFADKSTTSWMIFGVMGVLCTYVAYYLYYTGLRRAEATRAALVASLEPVVAAVLAAIFFGERFGLQGAIGAVMVVATSWLAAFWQRDNPDAPSTEEAAAAPD